jgi:hypothetical protein
MDQSEPVPTTSADSSLSLNGTQRSHLRTPTDYRMIAGKTHLDRIIETEQQLIQVLVKDRDSLDPSITLKPDIEMSV